MLSQIKFRSILDSHSKEKSILNSQLRGSFPPVKITASAQALLSNCAICKSSTGTQNKCTLDLREIIHLAVVLNLILLLENLCKNSCTQCVSLDKQIHKSFICQFSCRTMEFYNEKLFVACAVDMKHLP